jgi:transitional endoplasmic reticulum ATPase
VQPEAIEQAVKRWEGFSVARISAVGDAAGRAAAKARKDLITYPDLQAAMRETQGRAGKLPPDTPLLSELVMPQELSEQIKGVANRMKHIEETERLGGKIPRGILFWGPPGTGKTITARSLAKTAGWAFLETTGSVLLGNPDKIDDIVRQARDIRPCIVFLDEGDDVLAHRQMNPHAASVTNRLLTAIDGAGGAVHDVVWVAATNHPENIDPAAMRGGRFTVKLRFDVPDKSTLAIFIAKWMKASAAQFEPECQPAALAGILVGLSIANTKAVLQQAADRAVDRKMLLNDRSSVCLNDVREAKKLIVSDF